MNWILNRSLIILLLMLPVLLPSVVCAGFIEQRLAVIPEGYQLVHRNIVFTPDGSKVAFAAQLGDKFSVVFGDRVGKLYGHVRHISISPDGRFVAHNGTPDPRRDEEYRVVNDIETGPFQQVCNPVFSPDSRMTVFEAKYADRWRHAISAVDSNSIAAETEKVDMHWMQPVFRPDGRFIVSIQQRHEAKKNVRLVSTVEMLKVHRREYDLIINVVYSADGLRTAYVARKGGKQFVVTSSFAGGDEREGTAYDAVSQPVLSADGAHVAYLAKRGGKRFLVIDGREIPALFFNELFKPVFSRDWRTFAYGAIKDRKQFVVVAGKESPLYDDLSGLALSPDGEMAAYGALVSGKWRLIVNGNEGPEYDSVDAVQFAPEARHVVFRATRDGKRCMVIADLKAKVVQEGPMFDEIWAPSFDTEGRLGYGALAGSEIWWKVLPEAGEKPTFNTISTKLATISAEYQPGEIVFSPNGRRVIYAAQKEGKWLVVEGEQAGKSYDNVLDLVFSPDSQDAAYTAAIQGKYFVVANGEEGKLYESLGKPNFSPAKNLLFYEAQQGGKWLMVVNGKESASFDMPYAPPLFSGDERHIAYIEQHYDRKKNNLIVCASDMTGVVKGKEYDLLMSIATSPDHTRLAYVAIRAGKRLLVAGDFTGNRVEEKEGPPYDEISGIAFSPDSKRLVYAAKRGDRVYLVDDGIETVYEGMELFLPLFSGDGTRIAAVVVRGSKMEVMAAGKKGRSYDEIGKPVFSPDGAQIAYPARKEKTWVIVVNEKEGPVYDMIVFPQFSPDGSRVVYRARKDGKRFVVAADKDGRTLQELPFYEMVWQPVFTPDGKSVAYGVKDGQELWWKVEKVN